VRARCVRIRQIDPDCGDQAPGNDARSAARRRLAGGAGIGQPYGLFTAGPPTNVPNQAQQFLFFWPATSRNKKGFDLNISDLAISYCTTS
jgi:hypothetical protein